MAGDSALIMFDLDELAKDTLPTVDQIWIRPSTARMLLDDTPSQARALLLRAAEQARGLADATAGLAPYRSGRVLHIVGDLRADWADDPSDALKLRYLRWHESQKGKGPTWNGSTSSTRTATWSRGGRTHLLGCLTEWAENQ